MSWCVWLLPSPLTHTTDGLKERKIRWLVLQSWGQFTVSGPGLRWASVWNSHVPAFLLFILIYLILPLCHSLGPSYAALKFANPEYIAVSGKPLPFFHIHDIETYPCFLAAHKKTVEFYFLAKLQRETKKYNLLKVMQPLRLSLVPFLVLTSSWITTIEGAVRWILSNKSLSEYTKFK